MKKRIISTFAALAVAFLLVADCAPRAQAIAPIGIVQSALASYVSTTGYKLYNDQGTGQQIIGSLSDLYDTWLNSTAGQAFTQFTLANIAAAESAFQDQSGHFVVRKHIVDVWQSFCEWIQSNFSVPTNGTSVQLLQATTGGFTFPEYQTSGTVTITGVANCRDLMNYARSLCPFQTVMETRAQEEFNTWFANNNVSGKAFAVRIDPRDNGTGNYKLTVYCVPYANPYTLGGRVTSLTISFHARKDGSLYRYDYTNTSSANWYPFIGQVHDTYIDMSPFNAVPYVGQQGLAASIAQGVLDIADRVGDAASLVIDVGATAGATPAEMEAIVADGIKAGTLEPSVTVVDDSVINTPAQPYPDIDSLGLPALGAALISRFPFCIPWDFVDTIKLLSAEPQAPYFQFDIIPQRVKNYVGISSGTTITIDLSQQQYSKIGEICRWGSLIGFCFGLALLTKRMIWTA